MFTAEKSALKIRPNENTTMYNLANTLLETGDLEEAKEYFKQVATTKSNIGQISQFLHQALAGKAPKKTPHLLISELFDGYADHFEGHLVSTLNYKVPTQARHLLASLGLCNFTSALDLGCGTGLGGQAIEDFSTKITGVDLSQKMLELAKKKLCYGDLVQSDLHKFLEGTRSKYDLVISLDVLNYIGDLSDFFRLASKRMLAGAHLVISTESTSNHLEKSRIDSQGYFMNKRCRYLHSRDYVCDLAQQHALCLKAEETAAIRQEAHRDLPGTLFIFQLTS